MAWSKREKMIGIGVGGVLGLLVLDQLVLSPMFASLEDVNTRLDASQLQQAEANQLFERRTQKQNKWIQMTGGSLPADQAAAENQLLARVQSWAQASGMTLASLKPEASEKDGEFQKIVVRATGSGTMEQLTKFLYRVQTADVAARVSDMQINTRKEAADDLAIVVGIATLFEPPAKPGGGEK